MFLNVLYRIKRSYIVFTMRNMCVLHVKTVLFRCWVWDEFFLFLLQRNFQWKYGLHPQYDGLYDQLWLTRFWSRKGGIQTPPPSNENSTFLNLRIKITKNRHQTLLVNRIISWGPFWKMFWIRLCIYGIFLKIDSRHTLFFIGNMRLFLGGGGIFYFARVWRKMIILHVLIRPTLLS